MRGAKRPTLLIGVTAVALAIAAAATLADAKRPQKPSAPYPPAAIFIQLGEDFYRDLAAHDDNTRTLSTNMSETYLRQIAVATRYTVETNLKLLQQQARIIELLEDRQGASTPTSR